MNTADQTSNRRNPPLDGTVSSGARISGNARNRVACTRHLLTRPLAIAAILVVLLANCNQRQRGFAGFLTVRQNAADVTTIDFGDVPVGQTATQTLTVTFLSEGAELSVSDPGNNFGQENNCPKASANNGTRSSVCTVTVSASPTSPGQISAKLQVALFGGGEAVIVALRANGVAAAGPVLHMGKTTQTPTYTAGGSVQFTLTVMNTGNASTNGTVVTVTDTLDASLTPFPLIAMNWTCNNPTTAGAMITCTRTDALASGSSYDPIVIQADVSQTPPASITNTANVSGGGAPNASGSATTTLQ